MRLNYKSYPTDYVQQLNTERGVRGRKKSRAFMEYWNDMEHGIYNSESFYAKSWGVSRSTAHEWIKDYTVEIELFLNHWNIKNKQHYSHVKNATEQNEQGQPSNNSNDITQNIGGFDATAEQNEQGQPREALNLNNNTNTAKQFFWQDKDFEDLFFVYGANTKFKGRKDEAFEVFKYIDIDIDLLKLASLKYLHDPDTENRRYNLTNFLKNQTYLSYMPKLLKIKVEDEWILGEYDEHVNRFKGENGFVGELTPKRLVELYGDGSLIFVNPVQRKVS